jgi:hypothetical protein
VIRHRAIESQPAKPPVGEVQVHLFAQPSFRADAEAVAHDQHADHQFRVNRRPAYGAVEGRQLPPQTVEFDKPINRPQQVPSRHMPFERKLVEQRLLMDLSLPHHRLPPSRRDLSYTAAAKPFFNTIAHEPSLRLDDCEGSTAGG